VALGTHDVLTQAQPFYKVTGVGYNDHLTASGFPDAGSCRFSATQNNMTTFAASGQTIDGGLSPSADGSMSGFLHGAGTTDAYAEFAGCQFSGGQWTPYTLTGTGTGPFDLDVDIALPPGDAPARITWHQRPLIVGDVDVPPLSQCVVHGLNGGLPDPVTTSAPREQFLEPGPHTITLDAPATVPGIGVGTLASTAHYALTFARVNEDGSPYTG